MKKDRQQMSLMNIGSSSLLIVFLVLCLVTFAMLSMVSAKRDIDFSKQLADRRTTYYSVNTQAEQVAAAVDDMLADVYIEGTDGYLEAVQQVIATTDWGGVAVALEAEDDQNAITYQISDGGSQALCVKLVLADPAEDGVYYKVAEWQMAQTSEYNEEQKIELMQMPE